MIVIEKIKVCIEKIKELWGKNYYFTLWFIPGNGQNIAKKDINKKQLKYCLIGLGTVLGVVFAGLGIMAHITYQNYLQQEALQEFKQTKSAQEEKITKLAKQAEKNQQQLAEISDLEEQLRNYMQQSGVSLPPRSDVNKYGGKGGPSNEAVSEMDILLEQEKNINLELQAQKENMSNLLNVIKQKSYRDEVTPNLWPVSSYEITSYFGGRVNPFNNYSSDWHPGIDIAESYGAPIHASASGVVESAGWNGGYGRYVKIAHDYGYETAYGHMSSIAVRSGEYVKKGDIIGYVGSTGYSTGPHLHFEVIKYGEKINPLEIM